MVTGKKKLQALLQFMHHSTANERNVFIFGVSPTPLSAGQAKVVGSAPVFRNSFLQDSLQVAQMSPLRLRSFPPEAGRANRGMLPG